jgi:hypothetical protein
MISQTLTTSFKQELFLAVHNFSVDTFKLALFTASAPLNAATTVYATTNEIVGGGYTAGGIILTGTLVSVSGTTAFVNFTSPVWNPASFTARGGLIYNSSKSNKSVAILDFGADKTAVTQFVVTMPPNTATSALLRLP